MMLNGVVLVSTVLNWQDQDFHPGNDRPCFIHLPTYTATAWYHKKLPPELSGDLAKTLAEAEAFALDEYGPALLQGDRLPDARRKELAAKIARYTGLSPAYVERSNLCVEIQRFTKELLRDQGKTTGRLDTRFTGTDLDSVGEETEFDPGERLPGRRLLGGDQRLHPARPQVRERSGLRAADRQGRALGLDLPQPVRGHGRRPAPGDDPQPPSPGADGGRRLRPRDPLLRRLLHPRPPGAAARAARPTSRSSSTRPAT